jgi:hypothetical protein
MTKSLLKNQNRFRIVMELSRIVFKSYRNRNKFMNICYQVKG